MKNYYRLFIYMICLYVILMNRNHVKNDDEKSDRGQINFRISKEEKNLWKEYVHYTECDTLSDFIKLCVNEQLKKQIKKLCTALLPELKKELDKYQTLFRDSDYKAVYEEIFDAYLLKKPLTGIEFYDKDSNINPFIISMSRFFFVGIIPIEKTSTNYSAEIFVTRFKNILDIALKYKLDDNIADLTGLIYGYSPKEIFDYCVKRQLTHLIK